MSIYGRTAERRKRERERNRGRSFERGAKVTNFILTFSSSPVGFVSPREKILRETREIDRGEKKPWE